MIKISLFKIIFATALLFNIISAQIFLQENANDEIQDYDIYVLAINWGSKFIFNFSKI